MSRRLSSTLAALAIVAAACVGGDGTQPGSTAAQGTTASSAPSTTRASTVPGEEGPGFETVECDDAPETVSIVCEAYELIIANYVDPVEDEALVAAAIAGIEALPEDGSPGTLVCPLPTDAFVSMCDAAAGLAMDDSEFAELIVSAFALNGLDPNSAYLDPNTLALLQEEQQGQIEGIGALVSPEDETIEGENKQCAVISETCRVVIVSTIEETPAEAAGLQGGDVIVAVDSEDIKGWTIDEVAATVRGPAGTDVTLTIERDGSTFDVTITRAAVAIPVLEAARFGDDGYIRLRVFNAAADEQFQSAVVDMVSEGIDDLVVDLRNNPGGLLDTAIEITSVFLSSGDVVVTEGPNDDISYQVTGASILPEEVDVIVIVNRGSASASEVLSAVLQERERAVVVGENTFGKNTVQQRYGLSNGGALKLTIARWLTPGGLDFGGVGITPDVTMTFESDISPEDLVAAVVNLG